MQKLWEGIFLSKNSKVLRLIIGLVSLIALLVVSQVATPAEAATNYKGSDFTTSASVTNGPDFKHADTIDIQYNLNFGETPIKDGDTITLDFPENLKGKKPGDTFDVTDQDGTVIGKAVVSDTGGVITMNDKLEGKTNDKLTLNLATKYRYEDTGEKDVVFPLENNGSSTSKINIVSDDANLSKKGTLQDDGTVKWTILVNRNELKLDNLDISDTIGDNQEMIHGVTVSNGTWVNTTTYKREKPEISSDEYKVTYNDNGFDLSFNDPVSNLIVIDYYTKVTDPSLIHSGYKFRNNAVMEWGAGNSGDRNSEEANGKVSSSTGNSGSGGGDTNETDEEEEEENTGTIDTDGGSETDKEEKDREGAEQNAKNEADEKAAAAKKAAAAAKAAALKPRAASVTKHAGNTKLPQTIDNNGWVTTAWGLSIGLLTLGGAVIRRHF